MQIILLHEKCRRRIVMTKKTTSNVMKAMGATLAVCSAVAIMGASKTNSSTAKKTMKKTVGKVADFVDSVASFM